MRNRIQPPGRIDGRRRAPFSKRELAELAGCSVKLLNKENALGRLAWERDTSQKQSPAVIQVAVAKRWLDARRRK